MADYDSSLPIRTFDTEELQIKTKAGTSIPVTDNGSSLTVDANDLDIRNLNLTDDAVKISKDANANSSSNPIYVQEVAGANQNVYDYELDNVAKNLTATRDYAIPSGFTKFAGYKVLFSASGAAKIEIQVGLISSLVTKFVGYISTANPTIEIDLANYEITGAEIVRIIKTNRDNATQDIHSTLIGVQS